MVRQKFKKYFFLNVALVMVIAALALIGWQFNVESLLQPFLGRMAVNPFSAITLLMAGTAAACLLASRESKNLLVISRILSISVIIVGILKILDLFNIWPTHFDTYLFNAALQTQIYHGFTNSMSLFTAICFVLTGISLLLHKRRTLQYVRIAHGLALIILFASLLAIISSVYEIDNFLGHISFMPMAFPTSLAFLFLSFALLLLHSDNGFMGEVTGDLRGAQAARLFIPVAILVPIILGILRLKGEEYGLISTYYGTALFTVANIVIFILFIWKGAASINRWNMVLLREIEDRKSTESRIKETNIFLDTILEFLPIMVVVKDARDLSFIRVNRETERILGITRDEFIGKNDHDFFDDEEAVSFIELDKMAIEMGEGPEIAEEKVTTYNGERWLNTIRVPVFDEYQNPLYVINLSEDITARRKDEEKIRNFYRDLEWQVLERTEEIYSSEKRFRALVENSVDVILMTEISGKVKYISPPVEKITGIKPEEIIGEEAFATFHPQDTVMMERIITELVQKPGETMSFAARVLHQKGNYIWVEGMITNLLEEDTVQSLVFNYHDATEKRNSEERLKKYYEEVKRSNKELEQFAYIASHDLQEPLRMVSSFLQLLEKRYTDLFDETAKKYIHFALDGAERMKRLILDLLAYSRIGAGKEVFEEVNLNDVVGVLQETFGPELQRIGGTLLITEPLPLVRAIRSQMSQLFQNLVGNSIKYRSEAPLKVSITWTEEERHFLFKIEDNGIGIDPKFFDKLFVLFQRLHEKSEHSGTGIGLAICKKIVESHGGIIWVESAPGKGSTFYFMIKKM